MFLPKIRSSRDRKDPPPSPPPSAEKSAAENTTVAAPTTTTDNRDDGASTSTSSSHVVNDTSQGLQRGVGEMDATLQVWSPLHIYLAYGFIWLVYFVDSMHSGMGFTLTAYVTSSFSRHGLTATTQVFAQLIGALAKLPLARILDVWGRPQGLALTVILIVVGLVMMAACRNVETYAAAQVFYWVGFNGVAYTLQVFTADTSELKNRAFVFAFINTPFIVSTPTSGYAAQAFLRAGGGPRGQGWRWAFGAFSIIVPVVVAPIFLLFIYNRRRARRAGLLAPRHESTSEKPSRSVLRSVRHHALEFDAVGILLAAAGMALLLLPFNIVSRQPRGWRTPAMPALLVSGVVILVLFVLYERRLKTTPTFVPFALLRDRTVVGACLTVALRYVAFYVWVSFFSSYLQVVAGADLVRATWVGRIYNIVSCFWGVVVGILIRWTGRFKWLALYLGVPLQILAVGLMMIPPAPGRSHIGVLVVAQVFLAVAGGTVVICEQMAVMAAVAKKHVAVVLAVLAMFSSIGGAVGSTVSSAIWNAVFPARLARHLPAQGNGNGLAGAELLASLVASLPNQLDQPRGSPVRVALEQAYIEAQRVMLITATAVLALTIFTVAVWRDLKVKDFEGKSKSKS